MPSLLRFSAKTPSEREIRAAFRAPISSIADAYTAAVSMVTDSVIKLGRINISASGRFTGKWLSGLQARKYPKRKSSLRPKAFISHRFGGIADVFEFGSRIRPKTRSYLWVPLPGTPKRTTLSASFNAGRLIKTTKRTTAGRIGEKNGGLIFLRSKGGKPMLGVTKGKGKRAKFKPMFVGIKLANIRKRWSVLDIAREQTAKLPGILEANLKKAAN